MKIDDALELYDMVKAWAEKKEYKAGDIINFFLRTAITGFSMQFKEEKDFDKFISYSRAVFLEILKKKNEI